MPQSFWVGLFPEAISTRQDKAVYLLGILCGDVLSYRAWVDDSIHSTNLRLVGIEAQGVSRFPEWNEHVREAVGQVKVEGDIR